MPRYARMPLETRQHAENTFAFPPMSILSTILFRFLSMSSQTCASSIAHGSNVVVETRPGSPASEGQSPTKSSSRRFRGRASSRRRTTSPASCQRPVLLLEWYCHGYLAERTRRGSGTHHAEDLGPYCHGHDRPGNRLVGRNLAGSWCSAARRRGARRRW